MLLSVFGTLLGLALAYGTLRGLQAMEVEGIPRLAAAGLNPWVLGFSVMIAILTGVLSGLAPALQTLASGTANAMRDGDHQTGSRGQGRLRGSAGDAPRWQFLFSCWSAPVCSFVALPNSCNVNSGFQTESRLVFSMSMPASYYQDGVGKQFLDRFFRVFLPFRR